MKKYSPGRYFYLFGSLLILLGLAFGVVTVYDWFRHVTHYLLAVLTALLIISGLQITLIGIISDVLMRNYSMLRREVEEIRRSINESKRDRGTV